LTKESRLLREPVNPFQSSGSDPNWRAMHLAGNEIEQGARRQPVASKLVRSHTALSA
jgi:hypothetical protein